MDKKTARRTGLAARAAIPAEERTERSEALMAKVIASLPHDRMISCYLSVRDELETSALVNYCLSQGIPLCVPRVINRREMLFLQIESLDQLADSKFGIPEPREGRVIPPEEIFQIFVPLSSFDSEGNRTGYGRGYYDRVLTPAMRKIGLAFAEQQVDTILCDPWDVKLDEILIA